eukprot:1079371-Prorocentrum_minimum.AAC.1
MARGIQKNSQQSPRGEICTNRQGKKLANRQQPHPPTAKSERGSSMSEGGLTTVEALIAALFKAAKAGYVEDLETLVAKGARLDAFDNTGMTVLHWAAFHTHADAVRALIELGVNVEVHSHEQNGGSTALHFAASRGSLDTVRALVECGADVHSEDTNVRV